MMERENAVAFDALAAMPNEFLRMSACRPIAGFFTAALAAAAAAFASRLACRAARTASAACSASACVRVSFGFASRFFAILPSSVIHLDLQKPWLSMRIARPRLC